MKTEPFTDTYDIVTAKAHFTFDPRLAANQIIADISSAPRNASGLVEAAADLVLIQPRDPARSNGTTLFEVSNRGGFTSLNQFNGAPSGRMAPGNQFLMRGGYTIAWLGWQFGLPDSAKFRLQTPIAPVRSIERWYTIGAGESTMPIDKPGYCATASAKQSARLYTRASIQSQRQLVPAANWSFPQPCSVKIEGGFKQDILYELVYEAEGSPVAGIGLAAIRDFISWMKTNNGIRTKRAIGYGYSQSARMLRQMVYDGFNADEKGRIVFDGLLLAAGGGGRGSFNHRFAEPGVAGNSTEGFDEPVDIFPFADKDLLERARQQSAIPRIFHMMSSTEYWARVASLTHTTEDGKKDIQLPATSRLYYFAGTPHSPAAFPPVRRSGTTTVENLQNPYGIYVAFPALLTAMQAWLADKTDPPPSRYPTLARNDLVAVDKLKRVSTIAWPAFVPPTTRLDFGPDFQRTRIITKQPPERGAPYTLLVPQVNAEGNETAGVQLPHVAVPLATFTGWNRRTQSLEAFGKLAGLAGSYIPFAWTKSFREQANDTRPSVKERYADKQAYLQKVRAAAEALVKDRFLLSENVDAAVERAAREWDYREQAVSPANTSRP